MLGDAPRGHIKVRERHHVKAYDDGELGSGQPLPRVATGGPDPSSVYGWLLSLG